MGTSVFLNTYLIEVKWSEKNIILLKTKEILA